MIRNLLAEEGLELDDVRWYLAGQFALRILDYKNRIKELTDFVWSKKLESELYDMEEKYLIFLDDQIENKQIDESRLREILSEIKVARKKRYNS